MKEDQAQDEGYNPAGGRECRPGSGADVTLPLGERCGIERWPVKILADKDKSQIDFTPITSRVEWLSALPIPRGAYEYDKRIAESEMHVYRIRARLLRVRDEADSDIHMIIADPDSQELTMIAEIPAPFCAVGTGHEKAFAKVREIVHQAPIGSIVDIDGVGFFDVIHGQRGRARNGIELHPVLSLRIEP